MSNLNPQQFGSATGGPREMPHAAGTRTVQQGQPSNPAQWPGNGLWHVARPNGGSLTTAHGPFINLDHYGRY